MAAGKRYSAGAIFLQVVPVFANTQRAIEDEAKNIDRALGDQMERSGEKAGERAGKAMASKLVDEADKAGDKAAKKYAGHFETQVRGAVKSAQKEFDSLSADKFGDTFSDQIEKARQSLKKLNDQDFSIDFDADAVVAEIKSIETMLKGITKGDWDLNVHANLREIEKDMAKVRALAEAVAKDKHEVRFGAKADFKQAERELGSFEKKFQSSIKSAMNSLGDSVNSRVAQVRTELESLSEVEINLDMDASAALAEAAAVEAFLTMVLTDKSIDIDVRHNIEESVAALAKLREAFEEVQEAIDELSYEKAERKVGAFEKKFRSSTKKAAEALEGSLEKKIRDISADLEGMSDLEIGVDISAAAARNELARVTAELRRIQSDDNISIDVAVETGAALAELAAFEKALDAIDKRNVEAKVKTDVKKTGRDAEDAANSFRSFNIILLAAVSIGPALIPILAGIAGGLLALGPAAAVGAFGLGAMLVGFSGLGDALSALQSQQDQAATNAQTNAKRQVDAARQIENAQEALSDARRNAGRAAEDAAERVADARQDAARAAEDAAERVADAREAAADAIEDALERQKDAQEDYRDAVQDVADAEKDLRDAREEARKDAETLANRQRQNAVDERQAVLDLAAAQAEFNAVNADGSSTDADKEQASVNLEQAQITLNETRDEQVALADEAADYAANGVDGSEKVQDAQDAVTEALEAQKEAQEAVKEAAEAADEARVEGAKAVQRALEDQAETLADGANAISDALEDQAESASDNARNIERAKEALSDARRQAVEDLKAVNAQQQAVNAAFDKLGPAGRKFALFLFGLKSGFYEFRDAVQSAMLPAVQEAIEGFIMSPNAGKARDAIVALAEGFGKFTQALSVSFQGPVWGAFFEMLAETGPAIQEAYGNAFISVMEAFASILTVAAPFALRFAEGLEKMMDQFADWAASKQGAEDIKDFIAYAEKVGPAVLDFFSGLAGAFVAVVTALAPFGEVVLNLIDGFLELIATMDSDILQALLTGLTVILLASQVAYAVMNLTMSLGALFATTIGPWVFIIVGIAAALVYLYHTNEDFRKFINDAWESISKALKTAWEDSIKPALMEFWDALKILWKEVLQPFLEWLAPILMWAVEHLIPAFGEVFGTYLKLAARYIRIFVRVVTWFVDFITDSVETIQRWWGYVGVAADTMRAMASEAFRRMRLAWSGLGTLIENVYNDYIAPIWDAITATALPALQTAFQTTVDAIGGIWEGLQALVGAPIKFVIERIINDGLIAGYNTIAGWVNGPKLDPVKVPEVFNAYATGGILPGYTPGRDPHVFRSPTAGTLALSGGEAIMRPEWTRAVGSGFVDQMNALAASGGVGAVKRAMGYATGGVMQAFAKGGVVWPLPGGYVNRTSYNLGHDGMDINHINDASGKVPFVSATSGRVTYKGYSRGYGDAIFVASPYGELVYGHGATGTHQVAMGDTVRPGQWLANVGATQGSTPVSGPHLHFGFPNGSFAAAEALLSGASRIKIEDITGGGGPKVPKGIMKILKDPLGAFKGWITDPLKNAAASFSDTALFDTVSKVPARLGRAVVDKMWDIVPGYAKKAAGWAGDKADWVVGGVKNAGEAVGNAVSDAGGAVADFLGFAKGGILPYNGAMMYDNGGYLQPGLTTVMNLTGKPEPVFTADQFDGMQAGAGAGIHYEPHFEGSDLKASDVTDDLDFTFRKLGRGGRYGRTP